MKDKVWYTASEFSAELGKSRQWAFTVIKKGLIKVESFGGLYKIHRSQVEKLRKLLKSRKEEGKNYLFSHRKRS